MSQLRTQFKVGSKVASRRNPARTGQIIAIEEPHDLPMPHMKRHLGRAHIQWGANQTLVGRLNTSKVFLDELLLVG